MKVSSMLGLIGIVVLLGCNSAAPSPSTQESSSRSASASPTPAYEPQKNPTLAGEQTTFGAEIQIAHRIPLPKDVIKTLMLDERIRQLLQWRTTQEFEQAFAASEVDLNEDNFRDIIVQAVDPRLLGANVNPFWVFRNTGKDFKLVLKISALGLQMLQQKTSGFRDIQASRATAKELLTTIFKYDGTKYVIAASSRSPLGKE